VANDKATREKRESNRYQNTFRWERYGTPKKELLPDIIEEQFNLGGA
jgi:hypothetical protein